MKTTITIFAIAAFFTACNSNPKPVVETAKIPTEDTAGLANFKMQKEQEELIQTEGVYDGTNNLNGTAPVVVTKRRAVSSTPKRSTTRSTASRSSGSTSSGSGTASSGSGTTQAPAKKEGWSKAAKGAVIGGASGAVVGAVVSKKKGKGAIIGGILGAGGGYVIGRGKDKKDGRVQ